MTATVLLSDDPDDVKAKWFDEYFFHFDKPPYQNEESAYRAYIAASNAKPWSQKKENEAFQSWFHLWRQLSKQDRALLLVERMAERYPLEWFVCDDDGWANCIFCSSDRDEEHAPDCMAVLIQGFKR